MHPKLGLEMDDKANVMITFECLRCRRVQKRAYRQANADEPVTCSCGATLRLTSQDLASVQAQIDDLRSKIAEITPDSTAPEADRKPPRRAERNDQGDVAIEDKSQTQK